MRKNTENLAKIMSILADGQFHTGTAIGAALKRTRAAVWKMIKKLENYQVPLQSVKGKGYALQAPCQLLDNKKIKSRLTTKGIQLFLLETVDSTTTYLKRLGRSEKNKQVQVCIAETQTHGHGRFQREWYSPFGQNIYLSLRYPFKKDISELSGLSLIVGLAVCKAIETMHALPEPPLLKWPNDIICGQQKLAGSLIEIQAEAHGQCDAIIGVGINVNMMEAPEQKITQAWTSIQKLSQQYCDRNVLCAALIEELLRAILVFEQQGLGAFKEQWQTKDGLLNQTITLQSGSRHLQGTVKGINEHGHLRLQLPDGTCKSFASGDASLIHPK